LNFELIQHSKLRTQNFKGRLTINKKSPFAEKLTGFFVINPINPINPERIEEDLTRLLKMLEFFTVKK